MTEKAKAYDEVRKKIAIRFGSNVADEIFSQFEMSEDERIRKGLIELVDGIYKGSSTVSAKEERDKYVAWLEKQGEKNPVWSEEDEAILDALIRRLEGEDIYVSLHLAVKTLKSLKDRYTWKPNDESFNNTSCTCLSKKEAESKVWKQ